MVFRVIIKIKRILDFLEAAILQSLNVFLRYSWDYDTHADVGKREISLPPYPIAVPNSI